MQSALKMVLPHLTVDVVSGGKREGSVSSKDMSEAL